MATVAVALSPESVMAWPWPTPGSVTWIGIHVVLGRDNPRQRVRDWRTDRDTPWQEQGGRCGRHCSVMGAVLSRLIAVVTVAELPALSTAVPVKLWLAPSVETVTGLAQVWMPDSPSEQV
jgi:hypothetical protein